MHSVPDEWPPGPDWILEKAGNVLLNQADYVFTPSWWQDALQAVGKVCMRVCVCVCVCMYVCGCHAGCRQGVYVCVCVCKYVYALHTVGKACMCVCARACVCMYVCMYVCGCPADCRKGVFVCDVDALEAAGKVCMSPPFTAYIYTQIHIHTQVRINNISSSKDYPVEYHILDPSSGRWVNPIDAEVSYFSWRGRRRTMRLLELRLRPEELVQVCACVHVHVCVYVCVCVCVCVLLLLLLQLGMCSVCVYV
jgi:hypothetical protein